MLGLSRLSSVESGTNGADAGRLFGVPSPTLPRPRTHSSMTTRRLSVIFIVLARLGTALWLRASTSRPRAIAHSASCSSPRPPPGEGLVRRRSRGCRWRRTTAPPRSGRPLPRARRNTTWTTLTRFAYAARRLRGSSPRPCIRRRARLTPSLGRSLPRPGGNARSRRRPAGDAPRLLLSPGSTRGRVAERTRWLAIVASGL
jgi:hypothetical protein